MYEIIRNESGDLAEDIELIDSFFNKKLNKQSLCYRIYYRSHERNLVNTVFFSYSFKLQEIDTIQMRIREEFSKQLNVQLRLIVYSQT